MWPSKCGASAIFWPLKIATAALTIIFYCCILNSKCSHSLASIVAHWKISVFKQPKIEASRLCKVTSELPPIKCDPLNMRHHDFYKIFQPPKEATSGLKSVALNRGLTVLQNPVWHPAHTHTHTHPHLEWEGLVLALLRVDSLNL